jgi:hypothetical protein
MSEDRENLVETDESENEDVEAHRKHGHFNASGEPETDDDVEAHMKHGKLN